MATLLYVRGDCPHCARLRQELDSRGERWTEIDVAERPERIPELVKLTGGRRIVPVLVAGGRIAVAPEGGSEF